MLYLMIRIIKGKEFARVKKNLGVNLIFFRDLEGRVISLNN